MFLTVFIDTFDERYSVDQSFLEANFDFPLYIFLIFLSEKIWQLLISKDFIMGWTNFLIIFLCNKIV